MLTRFANPIPDTQRFITDRRHPGPSPLERAATTLSHAVEHLIQEQLLRQRHDIPSNREAIALLCDALRAVQSEERRQDLRARNADYLRERGYLPAPIA